MRLGQLVKFRLKEDSHLTKFLNCLPDCHLGNFKLKVLLFSLLDKVVGLVDVVQAVSLADDLVALASFIIAELFYSLGFITNTLLVERIVLYVIFSEFMAIEKKPIELYLNWMHSGAHYEVVNE